jgi:hypothetical protein
MDRAAVLCKLHFLRAAFTAFRRALGRGLDLLALGLTWVTGPRASLTQENTVMLHPSAPAAPSSLAIVETLAYALERVERGFTSVSAWQYRQLTTRLTLALRTVSAGPPLSALLDLYPATAELYENLHYEVAGLCRSPLQISSDAEVMARTLLARARLAKTEDY